MNNSNIFSEEGNQAELEVAEGINFHETSTNERNEDFMPHNISKDNEN